MLAIETRKAASFDEVYPEMLKNLGPLAKEWLRILFCNILNTGELPRIFKKPNVIAILRPGKDGTDAAH